MDGSISGQRMILQPPLTLNQDNEDSMKQIRSFSQLEQKINRLQKEKAICLRAKESLLRSVQELSEHLHQEIALRTVLENKNKELTDLSNTDSLTSLYNHRFMMERSQEMFRQSKRYGTPLSCVMVDIDHFKSVNDTYGHQFGDAVLRGISRILQERTRSSDLCGRYGGEEFIILMARSIGESMEYVSRLHQIIGEETFTDATQRVRVTVSIGLAEYQGELNTSHELIQRADQALYRAKQGGRNLIRIWKDEEEEISDIIDHFSIDELKVKFGDLYQQIKASYVESTNVLLNVIDAKDQYTLRHSQNVARYAANLAMFMGLEKSQVEIIKNAGLLHDIGKIGIEQNVLVKKGTLTDEEFEILKKHPAIGVNILKDISLLAKELPLILHHHERVDGTGYPHGLRSNEIPLGAKILAVVDAYDAMTTNREFQSKMSGGDALAALKAGRETQFSAAVVDKFGEMLMQIPQTKHDPSLVHEFQDISWDQRILI